jgi:NAD(P)-dependent dehydrogenase (short-subunit alcohol dehydrogenase family)
VFCVICGSIFFPVGQTALRGARADVHPAKFIPLWYRPWCRWSAHIATVRSVVAGGDNPQYDTTKAAIAGLMRALAADHSAEGIRVNAVGPGPIFTPFHARRIAAAGETVEQYISTRTPSGNPPIRLEEVGQIGTKERYRSAFPGAEPRRA